MHSIYRCCWNVTTYKWKCHNGEIVFCRKVSFFIALLCQFRGVGQGMNKTYLYMWYLLLQAQWDRWDERNHQPYNYLVTGHHIYSGT
jgi:hypothetical protein